MKFTFCVLWPCLRSGTHCHVMLHWQTSLILIWQNNRQHMASGSISFWNCGVLDDGVLETCKPEHKDVAGHQSWFDCANLPCQVDCNEQSDLYYTLLYLVAEAAGNGRILQFCWCFDSSQDFTLRPVIHRADTVLSGKVHFPVVFASLCQYVLLG